MWIQGWAGLLILIWFEHPHYWCFRVLSILWVASSLPRPFWLTVTTFAAIRTIHFRLVFTMLTVGAFLMMLRAIKYLCFQLLNAGKRKCFNTIAHIVMRPCVIADHVPEANYFLLHFCVTSNLRNILVMTRFVSSVYLVVVHWKSHCAFLWNVRKNVNLYLKCVSQKLEGCLTVHLPHEIMWNANLL